VHFHVPLFFQQAGPLGSTVSTLTPDFFHELRGGICAHLEIETYTFDVLPESPACGRCGQERRQGIRLGARAIALRRYDSGTARAVPA